MILPNIGRKSLNYQVIRYQDISYLYLRKKSLADNRLHFQFRTGVPWELLYADDLVVIADSLEECISKLRVWKAGMESKGLRVNMKKTKFLISDVGLNLLQDSSVIKILVICARSHLMTTDYTSKLYISTSHYLSERRRDNRHDFSVNKQIRRFRESTEF